MGLRLSICLLMLLPLAAAAAPLDEAKAEFTAGKEAFERGEYEKALQHYQRANQLVPAPNLQYNIGTCHEHLGHYAHAAAAFETYLLQSGPPSSDEDRDFQEKLRVRINANKKRAAEAPMPNSAQPLPPPLQQPPPTSSPYYTPPPTYYVPATPPPPSRELQLQNARARRTRAIGLMASGLALTVLGLAILVDGVVDAHTGCSLNALGTCTNKTGIDSPANAAEDFFGATFFVVGVTLWAPGAASYVNSNNQINTILKEESGGAPKAFLFHSPPIRF
jgi:tetratricopeptide (TPR) repeat protein